MKVILTPPPPADDNLGGVCIPADHCSCPHGEALYPAGAKRTQDCEECYCSGGRWECSRTPGCGSQCVVGGFGHYLTLDHTVYEFYGGCGYTLLSNCEGGNPLDPNLGHSFSVSTRRNKGAPILAIVL